MLATQMVLICFLTAQKPNANCIPSACVGVSVGSVYFLDTNMLIPAKKNARIVFFCLVGYRLKITAYFLWPIRYASFYKSLCFIILSADVYGL